MKKKALRKDFYREIRKSLGRFLSILFIVAMGVSFFSGIRAAEPDMRLSGDAYYDSAELMDIMVAGTLGVTEDDLREISKLEGVKAVEPAYSTDVFCEINEQQQTLHVMSLTSQVNQVTLSAGRLPEAADECLVDQDFLADSKYKIGDKLTFSSGTGDDLTDTLSGTQFRIVGAGSTPYYISFQRGSSSIGTGSISGYVMVTPEAFTMEVYTEIYALVTGAKEETAYTDGYQLPVDQVKERIEGIADARCIDRKTEIQDQINEELLKARKEFETEKAKAEAEISDAQAKLDEARSSLDQGYQEITDGKSAINNAYQELAANQEELNRSVETYESGQLAYEQAKAELSQAQAEFDSKSPEAKQKITAGETAIAEAKEQLKQLKDLYDQTVALEGAKSPQAVAYFSQWESGTTKIKTEEAALSAAKNELSVSEAKLKESWAQLNEQGQLLETSGTQLAAAKTQIAGAYDTLALKERELANGEEELAAGEAEYEEGKQELERGRAEAQEQFAEGEKKLSDAEVEIEQVELPKWYVQDRSSLAEFDGFGQNADRIGAIGRVFPVLFFLVAALISLTTMTRMVETDRIQIGTLKALGYSRRAIAGKYINYALVATLGGSVLGTLIGEKLFPRVIIEAYKIMYPHLPQAIVPYHMSYAAVATAAALFCTLSATWFACMKELRAQPAVLMRPPAPLKGKRVLIERVTFLWKRLSFIWKSTIRNLFRYKKRFLMTTIGIGGCMALMIVGYGIKDSISELAVIQYGELEHADATLYLAEDLNAEDRSSLYETIKDHSEVQDFAKMYSDSVTLRSEKGEKELYLYVPEETKGIEDFLIWRNRLIHKQYQLPDQGVILTEKMAKMLDVKMGDTITIKDPEKGDKKVLIASISENYMGHAVYMSAAQYSELYQGKPVSNNVLIKLDEYTEDKMQALGEELLTENGVRGISYMKEIEGQVDDMLNSMNIVIFVLIISAGMLAFVVLYNLNNINITERKRELATIKVLGFYDGEVGAYVYRENVLLTIIGVGVGIVLGMLLHQYVIVTVEIDTVMFGRVVAFKSYLYSTLWTIGFSCFVNFAMYFKLKKIDMIESLKSIE